MTFEVSPIERLLPSEQMAIWDATKRAVVDQSAATRRRASFDAMLIQETFMRTQRNFKEQSANCDESSTTR